MSEQSHPLPYRWIFPIGQLLICAVVLWPIRSEIVFQIRAAIRSYGAAKQLEQKPSYVLPYSLDINLDDPELERSFRNAERRLWVPTMLDMPVGIIQLPYVIHNPAKTEWVPNGMDVKRWRATSWPFVGLIFWWIAGRGVEALLAARRSVIDPSIRWVETGVGVSLLLCGIILLIAPLFAGDSDSDHSWVFISGAGAIWALLGAAIVIARITQWRIRLRPRNAQATDLSSG
jgi:hypothetical protein